MQRAWLREFNALGLQLRPQAAKLVTQFLSECGGEDPHRMAEILVEHTKNHLRSRQGVVEAVIDREVIQAVIGCMLEASKAGAENQDAATSIASLDLGDGIYVYNVMSDVKPYEYQRATKEWVPSSQRPELFPGCSARVKIYADRYHLLLQRVLLEGKLVTEAEASQGGLLGTQRLLTPVESLVGNGGRKLTFGLLSRFHDMSKRRWFIEDLNKVYPVELEVLECEHLLTDGSFVLAEGEVLGESFHIYRLDVPPAVPRAITKEKDMVPPQAFGGDLTEEQLQTLHLHEPNYPEGMYVVLCEVHLDSVLVLEKLTDLFQGFEESTPPAVYVFMGSFCSTAFVASAEGVRSYQESFERLKFMMRGLPNHVQNGTRFIFIPGPKDPGSETLPRVPLPACLTANLAKEIPNVIFTTNPCRVRHFSRELVFCRHDVLRLLRRHEVVPLREPGTQETPSPQHIRNEMVQFLMDQAHLVPLPLEQANVLWSFDHTLRLYPLPHAIFLGGVSSPFDCVHQGSIFCSVGPFYRDASFYAYYPIKDYIEPSGIPDRAF